jgi:hypothetical protein
MAARRPRLLMGHRPNGWPTRPDVHHSARPGLDCSVRETRLTGGVGVGSLSQLGLCHTRQARVNFFDLRNVTRILGGSSPAINRDNDASARA